MSCTRRGFLKTIGAAVAGLGLTRVVPLRGFAASSGGSPGGDLGQPGGPASGPYSADAIRAAAVGAALHAGDRGLAADLRDVCCWAPAAAAIRQRPLAVQRAGAQHCFRDFPGTDQLAEILVLTNNTSWQRPRFRVDPESLVERHHELLRQSPGGPNGLPARVRTEVVEPQQLNGEASQADLGLLLDRQTGERLAKAADRAEPMWAALSIFSGALLDPTNDLSNRLTPLLSLTRAHDRALARTAGVRYSQVVIGAVQRAIWSEQLDGLNPALPLVELSAAGYLPIGRRDGSFLLMRLGVESHLTGYRTESV